MKKIFNKALFTAMVLMAFCAAAAAQVVPPTPPLPPKGYKYDQTFDKEKFKQSMADLKVKMDGLSKQMAKLSVEQSKQVALNMRDFSKKFNAEFKDFGKDLNKNFSGSFSDVIPEGTFNSDCSISNMSADEYKEKLANGELTERTKTYSKSYSVDGNDVLQISNRFGKITVNTWNKNEFRVDVTMKFSSDNASIVDEMFDGTNIIDSKNGSVVSFRTSTWSNKHKGGDTRQQMSIDYNVYMPAGNALDIDNKFGPVTLPSLSGKATLRVQFGALTAQQLTNAQNDVSIKFSQDNPSTIAFFNGARLKVEFSKFKAGTIDNGVASFSFSDVSIDKLKSSADISIKFGDGLSIGNIDKSVKSVNINASNTRVDLDFNESLNFNFDVTTRLGSFNYNDDKVKVITRSPSDDERGFSQTKNYKGYVGRNNSGPNVVVNARFAEIKIK
ncbi:hypothetical protein ACFQZX_15795 [Mucilaginibacter litoreus]|uniref:Adhesin domain-containing protein n=1 Tax=Mucilaginibacter litoreus TaxID=1048221 RepID=A0ABW3AW21_9SPHI